MADRSATGPSGEDKPLRQRVDELEATVRGLTQELVETTERLRELEAELEGTDGTSDGRTGSANDVNTRTAEPGDTDTETDGDDDDDLTGQDDIIVA